MMYERILVFGAHPDDELHIGATMAKLAAEGTEVTVAIYTNGNEGYPRPEMKDKIVEMRRGEAKRCDEIIGVKERHSFERDDQGLVNDKQTLLETIEIIRRVRPQAIFTHGPEDRHRDHRNAHAITIEAAWHAGEPVNAQIGPPWHTPLVYFHCGVPGQPDIVIDVTDHVGKRVKATQAQTSQLTLFGGKRGARSRTLDYCARFGRLIGTKYGEPFWLKEQHPMTDFISLDQLPEKFAKPYFGYLEKT